MPSGVSSCEETAVDPEPAVEEPWMVADVMTELRGVDLAAQHRYGDPEAFGEVYRRFEAMVYNLALRMSGDPVEAEDLTQEVFLRVHRHLAGFEGRSTLKTWVFQVALNTCRSRLERRARWRRKMVGELEANLERLPDPGRGPEESAAGRDDGRRVLAALARVPWVFREAVVLRDLEGLSYEEISHSLGVAIGTVRSRIARGRNRLRAVLEEEG